MNIWATMSQIDIRKFTEKKNGFTYLSWAHALRILKEVVPDAEVIKHTFHADKEGSQILPYMKDEHGYAYVQVTIVIGENRTSEIMPVLNHANRPIQNPNSFEVNAQIQRCMAKAISMATGLGIHLYAGEDMPAQVSARPDNSGSTAGRGAASEKVVPTVSNHQTSDVAPPPNFKSPALTLEQEIALCPDIEALKSLYNRVERGLSPEDRQKFSSRKQELLNG